MLAFHVFPQSSRLPAWQLAQFAFQMWHLSTKKVRALLTIFQLPTWTLYVWKGKVKEKKPVKAIGRKNMIVSMMPMTMMSADQSCVNGGESPSHAVGKPSSHTWSCHRHHHSHYIIITIITNNIWLHYIENWVVPRSGIKPDQQVCYLPLSFNHAASILQSLQSSPSSSS